MGSARDNEELMKILKRYNNEKREIIVEGKKDARCLKELGLKKVNALNGRPLYKVVDEICERCKKAVILTDLDREGRKLYGVLQHHLKKNGVRVDNRLRDFLFKKTKLRQIEGLATYMEKTKH